MTHGYLKSCVADATKNHPRAVHHSAQWNPRQVSSRPLIAMGKRWLTIEHQTSAALVQLRTIYVPFGRKLWNVFNFMWHGIKINCRRPISRGTFTFYWILRVGKHLITSVLFTFRYWNASSISRFPASAARQWSWRHRSVRRRCQLCSQRHLSATDNARQTGRQVQTNTSQRHAAPEHKAILSRGIWVYR